MSEYVCKFPPLFKSQLLEVLENISADTLKNWMNKKYYADLLELGYEKKCKLLEPQVVEYLCNKLCIEPEEIKQKIVVKRSRKYEG